MTMSTVGLHTHELRAAGGLMVVEASPRFIAALRATVLVDDLGEENVVPGTDIAFESLDRARAEARRRKAEARRCTAADSAEGNEQP